ncbi:MAG: TetR/AcrR family transcriptional regulator [Marinilabiliaceae bacterium]|nr:TetR/AcrR family transcriptional regulator [Marinilabiliaceae bacterium]
MEEKRQLIIERTFDLFHSYGIKSVSMDDIARELGMSKKTLYQHVKDKSELVEAVVDYIRSFSEDAISVFYNKSLNAIQQHHSYWQKMDTKFVNYKPTFHFDLRKYYPSIMQSINEWKRKTIYEANKTNIEHGIKEGFYRDDLNAHIISRVLIGYQIYTFDPANGIFSESEITDSRTFEEVYKYHFFGVCTPKGLEEVRKLLCSSNKDNH